MDCNKENILNTISSNIKINNFGEVEKAILLLEDLLEEEIEIIDSIISLSEAKSSGIIIFVIVLIESFGYKLNERKKLLELLRKAYVEYDHLVLFESNCKLLDLYFKSNVRFKSICRSIQEKINNNEENTLVDDDIFQCLLKNIKSKEFLLNSQSSDMLYFIDSTWDKFNKIQQKELVSFFTETYNEYNDWISQFIIIDSLILKDNRTFFSSSISFEF